MYAHHPGASHAVPTARLRAPTARAVTARPAPTQATAVLRLQRLAGNAAVTRLIAARQRERVQAGLRTAGSPLDRPVLAEMEARLGADLSDVRVHTGPAADRAAQAVDAEAFTTGSHLVFGRGRYNPASPGGRRVLAHELTHVLQQRRGPVAGTGSLLKISDPADRFERAADATARSVISRSAAGRSSAEPGPVPVPATSGASSSLPVQRARGGKRKAQSPLKGQFDVYYGPTRNDCGTYMHAELWPGAPELSQGSPPSTSPIWWPRKGAKGVDPDTATWFSKYMVQGHLLNHNVGGPGNTMQNLTPITKATNHSHLDEIERDLKDEVRKLNHVVDYEVKVDYSQQPTGQYLVENTIANAATKAAVIQDIDNNYAQYIAYEIRPEYDIYDTNQNRLPGSNYQAIRNGSK